MSSKRIARIEKRAKADLMALIEAALVSGDVVELEPEGDSAFRVDMPSDEACYVGPFVVSVQLRPQAAGRVRG